jgi:hypothetical protein
MFVLYRPRLLPLWGQAVLVGTLPSPRGRCNYFDVSLYDTGRYVTNHICAMEPEHNWEMEPRCGGIPLAGWTFGQPDQLL